MESSKFFPQQRAHAYASETRTSRTSASTPLGAALQFGLPLVVFLIGASLCSFLLHVNTHRHVSRISLETSLFSFTASSPLPDLLREPLANTPFVLIGDRYLDFFCIVPMFFYVLLMLKTRDLQIWTKTMLVCFVLALSKGMAGLLTELPDARGGALCVARLTNPDFNEKALDMLLDLDFENNLYASVLKTFSFQLNSLTSLGGKGSVRYCSDMMFSGHTFFCLVACTAVSALISKHNVIKNRSQLLKGLVYTTLAFVPLIEALAVVATSFHYSVDVFIALLLSFFVWTNPQIDGAAAWWADQREVVERVSKELKMVDASPVA